MLTNIIYKNMKVKAILAFMMFLAGLPAYGQGGTPQDYDAYVAQQRQQAGSKYTYSQPAVALRYRDSLGLSPGQVSQLYQEVQVIKTMKNDHYAAHGRSMDTRDYESARMTQILTPAQYDLAMRYKNRTRAMSSAEEAWDELVLRGQTTGLTRAQAVSELYEYYVVRESIYDRYRHDLLQQQAALKSHFEARPAVLKLLYKSRKNPANSTAGGGYNGQN